MKIPILLGTTRRGRESEKVANLVFETVQGMGLETVLVDPRNLQLPQEEEGHDLAPLNSEFIQTIRDADGLIIVSPEYNHSFPGTLKRVLDMLDKKDCMHMPVGVVGVSDGSFGGVRMMNSLSPVLKTLGFLQVQGYVPTPNMPEIDRVKHAGRIKRLVEEVIVLAAKLSGSKS